MIILSILLSFQCDVNITGAEKVKKIQETQDTVTIKPGFLILARDPSRLDIWPLVCEVLEHDEKNITVTVLWYRGSKTQNGQKVPARQKNCQKVP